MANPVTNTADKILEHGREIVQISVGRVGSTKVGAEYYCWGPKPGEEGHILRIGKAGKYRPIQ